MKHLNSLIIEGIVQSVPIITTTKKGSPVCTFTIFSKHIFKQDTIFEEDSIALTVEAWGCLVDLCKKHCTKSCNVRIVGRLKQNADCDKIAVIAEHIAFTPEAKDLKK